MLGSKSGAVPRSPARVPPLFLAVSHPLARCWRHGCRARPGSERVWGFTIGYPADAGRSETRRRVGLAQHWRGVAPWKGVSARLLIWSATAAMLAPRLPSAAGSERNLGFTTCLSHRLSRPVDSDLVTA